jgi:uncharacterized membrane protein
MVAQPDEAPTGPTIAARGAAARQEDAGAQPTASSTHTHGRRWFRYTLPGAWGALILICLSFTPSLLPRSALVQGIVCGITAAIGYGLGVSAAWLWRLFADRDPRPERRGSRMVFVVTAAVALVVAFAAGQRWQAQIRDLMGAPAENVLLMPLLPLVAAAVFAAAVAASRSLRAAYHWTAGRLEHRLGQRAARALGWTIVVGGTYLVATGLLLDGLVGLADRTFAVRDTLTAEGAVQPASALRSGGPDSLVPGSRSVARAATSPARARPRRRSPHTPGRTRWSPSGCTRARRPPGTSSGAPNWPSRISTGRAASSARI